MRKSIIFCGIVAAFMFLTHNANAQYLPAQIHRSGASFVDEHGRTLSDNELIDAVGMDIFEETVIGARKQYQTGRKLLISGAAGLGVGLAGILGGAVMVAAANPEQAAEGQVYFEHEDLATAGGAVMVLGAIATALGGTALTVGIPFKAIGQSRLNWVENDYNERSRGYSLHVGAAPHGMGLTLNF